MGRAANRKHRVLNVDDFVHHRGPAGKCWRGFRHGTDGAGRHEPSIDSSADPLDGRLPSPDRPQST
jgi:hypothetical protein